MRRSVLALLPLAAALAVSHAFYIPAILPLDYQTGDVVDLWYNKVYSEKTQLPYEYVRLPICKPAEGERVIRENLGEILRGDRFIKSTYGIKFGEDVVCGVVCEPVPVTAEDATWLASLITNEYKVEWYLDGLPAATPYRTTTTGRKLYEPGFRLGMIETITDEKNPGQTKIRTFLNNHVSIAVLYNREDASISDAARIVGFEVFPRSISSEGRTACPAEIADGMTPQEIQPNKATTVLYTYSVEFREDKEVVWATRWDRFLINSDPNIHWYSIVNSLIILLFLTGMVAVIMLRTLYNDISLYNDEESKEEEQDEVTGWKLVHGDVFRPPQYGWLLAVMVGTGVQFLGAVLTTVLFATVGVLNPSYRGGMGSFAVFLFVFMGAFGGYYSSRIYKAFRGTRWQWNAFMTALMFPGIIFALLFLVNLFVWSQRSSSAIPFGTFVAIVALWSGVSLPLVMIGAYFGQKKKAIEHPVRTNQIPRQIPEVNWFLTPYVSILVGGLLPFAAVFIELFFIMKSVWLDQYYYMYGFLAIVFIILLITCVEITIVIIYFTLCAEDYNWWWRSFFISSSSSLYIFLYAIYYYVSRLDITHFVPTLVYFASVFDACLIFFLCTGTMGFLSSYYFVIKIYSAVKVD